MTLTNELHDIVFRVLGLFCHQIPDRSLFFGALQFPLCVRCTALTAGGAAAVAYLVSRGRLPRIGWTLPWLTPMCLDIALQMAGVYQGDNRVRAATGFLFGLSFVLGGLRWLAGWGGPSQARPDDEAHDLPWRARNTLARSVESGPISPRLVRPS